MVQRSSEISGAFFHDTVFLLTIEGLRPRAEKITVRCAEGGKRHAKEWMCALHSLSERGRSET